MEKKITVQWRQPSGEVFSTIFAGDLCPREQNGPSVAARAADIISEVKPLFKAADFRMLQWECAIAPDARPIVKSGPNHRCCPEVLDVAVELGTDLNLLANNHVGDYGPEGIMSTIAACQRRGIATTGAGANASESGKPFVKEIKGFKVAVLNSCEHEFGVALPDTPGSCGMEPFKICRRIKELKSTGHTVIVVLHGGHEAYPFPSPRMVELFRFFADSGADAVLNCHTHCPLGCEVYHGVPVVGSTGNFYFPTRRNGFEAGIWHLGYLPVISFDAAGAFKLEITPYLNMDEGIKLLDDEAFGSFEKYFGQLNRGFSDEKFCSGMFDAWCTRSGLMSYFSAIDNSRRPESWDDPEVIRGMMPCRNLFSCESHHDLMRNSMYLVEQKRVAAAAAGFEQLETYRELKWLYEALARAAAR